MRPPAPIPLTVVTGFLGSGKTTLLNRLLKDESLANTVVIINEFGEIGLDHLLIETVDQDMILLSSGCLCCTVRGDLMTTLEDLLRKRDNNRIIPFNRVIIETTGLADPAPVLQSVLHHPYLVMRYTLDGVITVIDAISGNTTLDAHEEAIKQAAMADCIVLTKTDLLKDQENCQKLVQRLKKLNPFASILNACENEIGASTLINQEPFNLDKKSADLKTWLDNNHGHHHDHGHHHHDVNRHDARIRAFALTSAEPIKANQFELFIDLLRSAHGPNLLRVKGLVQIAEDADRPVLIHGVQHVFHPPVILDRWPSDDHRSRLIFIARDLDPALIEALWNAFRGIPDIDQPDAKIMNENPLAPPGLRLG